MALFGHTKLMVDQQDGPVPRPRRREAVDHAVVRAAPRRHYRGPPASRGSARPSRQLAGELGVSRHTVTTVYGRLVAEGYAEGRAGGGSVVASASPAAPKGTSPAGVLRPSPRFAGWSPYFRPPPYGCRFDLRPGLPDPALFPAAQWRRQVSAAVGAEQSLYGDPAGKIRLRRAIVGWVARSRSVAATEDTVVVPVAPSTPSTW
jgi:Transcriptional regulators containing a DNA-binding HTH domain and an aminotransferase domain (MocR family) and their eukaryotic orthologs